MTAGVIARFRDVLPLPPEAPSLSLGEGGTPLVEIKNLPAKRGIDAKIFCKCEGANPTGSFKDRGMAVAVAAALANGAKAVVCASTGNTSAAAAAFAARAGLRCVAAIPAGKIAAGKMAQAVMHGAIIAEIDGDFDAAMAMVRDLARRDCPAAIVNSINPMRIQGQKTAALEIVAALGDAPDYHALPVGNAGNITAHWIGYCEAAGTPTASCDFCGGDCRFMKQAAGKRPIMLGYQAEGAAPFVKGKPVDAPQTRASAIRIGHPQSFAAAKIAVSESGGRFAALSDDEILSAQQELAREEGIFCEPASAASVAGVLRDAAEGRIKPGAIVVCTLTGHGLKDPDAAQLAKAEIVRADADSIAALLGG